MPVSIEKIIPFCDDEIQGTIQARFRSVARRMGDHTAIIASDARISYAALDNLSDQIGRSILQEKDLAEHDRVAIFMENGVMAVAAILGVLKAGKTFIIFSPDMPGEKLKQYWADCLHPPLIVGKDMQAVSAGIFSDATIIDPGLFPPCSGDVDLVEPIRLNEIAAIFYTSGTTGEPKGVIWTHELILHAAYLNCTSYQANPADRIAMLSAYGFGAAMTMSFIALLSGATLLLPHMGQIDLGPLTDWLKEHQATVLAMPPVAFYRQHAGFLAQHHQTMPDVRLIIMGGDSLYETDLALGKGVFKDDLLFAYRLGGSETMLVSELIVGIDSGGGASNKLSVGNIVPGKEVLLFDENLQPVEPGEPGEIVVRSRYLSPGYWQQPDATAKAFWSDPDFADRRLYLSGDMGKFRVDGQLEHLGRNDQMVKIHGYTVQLEVLNRSLKDLATIEDAYVLAQLNAGGSKRLVAYLVSKGVERPAISAIRRSLSEKLPDYMIPAVYLWVDALPRTRTGKINTKDLPVPNTIERPVLDVAFVAPRNDLEVILAGIWDKLLGVNGIGVDDNFFELGGDSLLVLQMVLEVEKVTSRQVPQTFFSNPTISFLAQLFDAEDFKSEPPAKFSVESSKSGNRTHRKKKKSKFGPTQLMKLTRPKSLVNGFDRLMELFIARYIVSIPYEQYNEWAVRWSGNSLVQKVVYGRRYDLLKEFVASLDGCQMSAKSVFAASILSNMSFGLNRYLGKKEKSTKSDLQAISQSRYAYWQTMGERLASIPFGEISETFPIQGSENLLEAYRAGRGVILLSFHGMPSAGRTFIIQRLLNIDSIPTISYRIPMRQSQYGEEESLSNPIGSTLRAEIALYAQRLLQKGNVVNMLSDTSDNHGKTRRVSIGGRLYRMKSGFADLALNTGAAVVPYYRFCRPDGRVELVLEKPFEIVGLEREEQVSGLMEQYARFIEQTWVAHPEAYNWRKMAKHLSKPKRDDGN